MTNAPETPEAQPFDTGRSEALRHVRYEDLLRAVGSYIDQHGFNDVLVTQLPEGVLLKGTIIDRTNRFANARISAVLFTNDDVIALLEASARRRGSTDQLRTRWMQQQS